MTVTWSYNAKGVAKLIRVYFLRAQFCYLGLGLGRRRLTKAISVLFSCPKCPKEYRARVPDCNLGLCAQLLNGRKWAEFCSLFSLQNYATKATATSVPFCLGLCARVVDGLSSGQQEAQQMDS